MKAPIYLHHKAARVWFGLAVVSCAMIAAVSAQGPVITNPADLHFLDVNTAFDTTNFSWAVRAPMPTARAGFAIATANDATSTSRVYVMGGAVLKDCTTIRTVEAYDPGTDTWITSTDEGGTLQPIPDPLRWRPTAATLDNLIYMVGGAATGETGDTGCNGAALATVQAYDPVTNAWILSLPDMNNARLQVGLGVDPINHLLYAVGGITAGPDFTSLTTVEVFDPTGKLGRGKWTTLEPLNTARGLCAVVVVDGLVYAVGGQSDNEAVTSVEVYDPATGHWHFTTSTEPGPNRLDPGTAVLNNEVYVVGGTQVDTQGRPLSTVNIYHPDPVSDSWSVVASMPTARRDLGAAAVGSAVFAIGGGAPIGRVGEPLTYQITATGNPVSYSAFPLPTGLSIDQLRGIISGVPTAPALGFVVTFSATDAMGNTGTKDVSFYIAPPPSNSVAPKIISSGCATARTSGEQGQPFTYQVLATNASPDAQFSATGLPYQQLSIDPGTGLISGIVTPSADGSVQNFGIEIAVADGATTTQSFLELTFVAPDSVLPIINSPSSVPLVLNQFFFYQISADQPTTSLDFYGVQGDFDKGLPPGLDFDPDNSTISGIFTGQPVKDSSSTTAQAGQNEGSHSFRHWGYVIDTIKKEPPPHIQLLATKFPDGTGTAPLNFITSQHDFEAEALPDQTSQGTNYLVFTDDPLTSGNAAGLLESTSVGEYVTYTVPVTATGTYDVKVGIKTDSNEGQFQLLIDGMNQGLAQDEYSPTPGYEILDLAPVTFTTTGSHTFQFVVSGQNANSTGEQLIFDYIDLDPYFESESSPIQTTSAYSTITDPNLSGGAGILLKAVSVGENITFTVPVAAAGIYNVTVGTESGRNEGIFQLAINGITQGYPQNEFAPAVAYEARNLGTVKIANAGNQAFQFTVTGRDPKSTNYKLAFDYIHLDLASQLEAEALPWQATARLLHVSDPNLSGAEGRLLNAKDANNRYVTYTVAIPAVGTYDIKVGVRTGKKSGIFDLAVDGGPPGPPQDQYSASVGYEVMDLGRYTFTEAGDHHFQFSVTGQNSNSRGYQLVFDYIDLVR